MGQMYGEGRKSINEGHTEDEEFKWIVKQPGKKQLIKSIIAGKELVPNH